VLRLNLPVPSDAPFAAAGNVGYGFLDDPASTEGGHRVAGGLALGLHPLPWLGVGADVSGRFDRLTSTPEGSESNLYGEPRLTLRAFTPLDSGLYLGAQAEVRFVGAQAPSIEPSATSPALRGLFATALGSLTYLGVEAGFELNRSGEAVPNPPALSAADRRTLGASTHSALVWGLGMSHRLSEGGTELLGEITADTFVGSDAPGFLESPVRLGVGARHPLSRSFLLMGSAEASLSKRPSAPDPAELFPIEPRVTATLSLVFRLMPDEPAPPPPPAPSPPVAAAKPR
jgi:hypothetical protein